MADSHSPDTVFIEKLIAIIEKNIANDLFGVSELANEVGMSRSNLLRKIKKSKNISVSQFIREVRLQNAMEMFKETSLSVTEVSYKVGFSSTSYFIKCFHDFYGYSPGMIGKKNPDKLNQPSNRMTEDQNGIEQFWQELKRRKVVKVIIVYATISFILLQVVSMLIKPLYLPQWIMTAVIVLLAIGFPIALIFSWIFDLTPSGIEVTKSAIDLDHQNGKKASKKNIFFVGVIGIFLVVVAFFSYPKIMGNSIPTNQSVELEKSIAVLPFKNDSNDSTNVYLINGLMESILKKLQNIEDLRVISRTSVEKYRNNSKTIPEIAKELNVNYFVEGSGQKLGDDILLHIQLIEGLSDKHLLSEQYNRKVTDIFELQSEIAQNIAFKIEAVITPEEKERLLKRPTDDLIAYDYYLKGRDLMNVINRESLKEAILFFEKAVEQDNKFATAYANIAIAYYLIDSFQIDKMYSEEINNYSDKALLFDDKLPESLISKAMYYMHSDEYDIAISYLEKALYFNPNSSIVISTLSDIYARRIPNTEKYLEYAVKGIRLDISAHDAISASYIYLHLGNAFIQSGFVDEALEYINRSLDYYPENIFSQYVKAYILYEKNKDLEKTKDLLVEVFKKDTTRLDVMQEVGKMYYYMRDYENAYYYYKKFIDTKESQNLEMFPEENSKIAVVLDKIGYKEESEVYLEKFKEYISNDTSIYKNYSWAIYHSYKGNTERALEHLKLFLQEDNYFIWVFVFSELDPLLDNIKDNPEFRNLMKRIEDKFWKKHEQIKTNLEEKEIL